MGVSLACDLSNSSDDSAFGGARVAGGGVGAASEEVLSFVFVNTAFSADGLGWAASCAMQPAVQLGTSCVKTPGPRKRCTFFNCNVPFVQP